MGYKHNICQNAATTEAFGRSGNRISLGARFSSPVQMGLEAHPAFCTMGLFLGVKRPQRGVDHSLPFSVDIKERVELHVYSPSGSSWPVLG
jgi:hypothetical protein